ncbi:MAG: hypothetical protein JXK95_11085 [Bacteroidales bacterium]|nr:hypothetical protein [Bacteroidales bacterium]
MLDDSVTKVKKSKTFGTVTRAFKKAEGYVDEKIDDFEKSELKEKLESLVDKAEDKAEDALKKMKDMGKDFAEKAEKKLDKLSRSDKKKPKA